MRGFSISDLFFSLSGFIFGFQEKQQAGKKASAMFKALEKFFGAVGIVFGTIASVIDLVLSCPSISPAELVILVGIPLVLSILISFISVDTGLVGFLISSIVQSVASTVAKLMMSVVKNDSGC